MSLGALAPVRITAVRHGETAWNVDTRIQGQIDIGLNVRGQWQAQQLGAALAERGIGHIYTSDLARAHHTALAIAEHAGIAPHAVALHAGLRERAFGVFEGRTHAEIETRWPQDALRWRQRVPDWAPSGGESPLQLRKRVSTTVAQIAANHPGEHIALVAHGGVLDMLYRLATGQAVDAVRTWELGNCAINRLLWTPQGLSLVGWADSGHLEPGVRDETTA
ncbi:MAG: histidine phosphatase family protein [Rhodoferax sp.]|nr:histidine phosphatase family protein [Rhodoferax sp.]